MSTNISTKDSGAQNATDRADFTIYVFRQTTSGGTGATINGAEPLGIAKTFSFNINKPKSPIYVLSKQQAVGFARNPEDRTFALSELSTFERIEHASFFTASIDPFVIRIAYVNKTDLNGNPLPDAKIKIIQLEGVEFEGVAHSVDANSAEYAFNFTGRFTRGWLSGDLDASFDPVTGADGQVKIMPL